MSLPSENVQDLERVPRIASKKVPLDEYGTLKSAHSDDDYYQNGSSSIALSDLHVQSLSSPEPDHAIQHEPSYSDSENDTSISEASDIEGPLKHVVKARSTFKEITKTVEFRGITFLLSTIVFHVFLGCALFHDFDQALPLLYFTFAVWVVAIYYNILKPKYGKTFQQTITEPVAQLFDNFWGSLYCRISFYFLLIAGIAVFLYFDTQNDRFRLYGLRGMAFYLFFMFIVSASPSRIKWRPVIWGFFWQFILGLLILRWERGANLFQRITSYIVTFLEYANYGSRFVYGFLASPPNICGMEMVFAFSYLQIIIYFGAVVALLYHFGIIQAVLIWVAWFMEMTLGTTAPESLNACACVFLGISEAPFLIKPCLAKMTPSELHAVMTSGFSCIAGAIFAAYISFGACPAYLLSSTVMSATGSLACSKLLYPETKKSKMTKLEVLQLARGKESNALEALSNGAVTAIYIVMAIVANIIVTLALIAFINDIFKWFGALLGYEGWSFELFVGYIFYPLAYLMGVTDDHEETMLVAQLMGIKTVSNEFIAYQQLGHLISGGYLSPRSAMIATYALCGFSNFQTLGVVLAIFGNMVPQRKRRISKLALRALMAGSISCFMTASLAGVLVENPIMCSPKIRNSTCFDVNRFIQVSKNLSP